jgi:hypothetical protein
MLKWLADIHDLCARGSVDWQKLRSKAERFDLIPVVQMTLSATRELFGTAMQDGFAPQVLPPDLKLFPTSLSTFEAEHEWRLFYPRLLRRPSDKLRWFAEMLFVPRLADCRFLPLPSSLSFLYYLLRPLRLIWKWTALSLSRVFEKQRFKG